jgi:hypothetical protein
MVWDVTVRIRCAASGDDPQGGEASVIPRASRRSTRTESFLVEAVGDLGIDVVIEELVDELDGGSAVTCTRRPSQPPWRAAHRPLRHRPPS